MTAVLSTAYFLNVQTLTKFLKYNQIIIDIYEHYSKQTYRNRCNILTANGVLGLSVPVKKNNQCYTRDVKIDYSDRWQKVHEKAILSAYKNSPFYEHYIDYFSFVFNKQETFLVDLNTKILDNVLSILKIGKNYNFSTDFISDNINNFKDTIHPKPSKNKKDLEFCPKPYIQVFSERFGFVENLSCLDLIFMLGPESLSTIKNLEKVVYEKTSKICILSKV